MGSSPPAVLGDSSSWEDGPFTFLDFVPQSRSLSMTVSSFAFHTTSQYCSMVITFFIFAYDVKRAGKTNIIHENYRFFGLLSCTHDVIINLISEAEGRGLSQYTTESDLVTEPTDEAHHHRSWRQRATDATKNAVHDADYITVDPSADYKIFASCLEAYNYCM